MSRSQYRSHPLVFVKVLEVRIAGSLHEFHELRVKNKELIANLQNATFENKLKIFTFLKLLE